MIRKIISGKETFRINLRGELETWVIYQYTLDDLGPFSVELPKSQDTPEAVKAEIDRKEALLKGIGGE